MPYSGMDLIQAYLDLDSETIMLIAADMDGRGKPLVGKTNGGRKKKVVSKGNIDVALGYMEKIVKESKAITYDLKIVDSQEVHLSKPVTTPGYRRLVFNGVTIASFYGNKSGRLRVTWETLSGAHSEGYVNMDADVHEMAESLVKAAMDRKLMKVEGK
jgi:hypothetical protein